VVAAHSTTQLRMAAGKLRKVPELAFNIRSGHSPVKPQGARPPSETSHYSLVHFVATAQWARLRLNSSSSSLTMC
jgi:hypothetical protein